MSQLMLVNPRKRTRSAAQKAATRRMLAANRSKRHGNPKRRSKSRSVARRSNPIRTRHVYHAAKRRRRNPSARAHASNIGGMLMNSLKGAGGAIAVNVITNYMPAAIVPPSVAGTVNYQLYLVRAAIGIGLGMFGSKVGLGSSARVMAEGALTVNTHDFLNAVAGTMLPGGGLHEYVASGRLPAAKAGQSFDSELNGMGEYIHA